MIGNLFWNPIESRLRSGWRLVLQVILISIPLAVLAANGIFVSDEMFALRVAAAGLAVTLVSTFVLGRYVDQRAFADYGIQLMQKKWWLDYGFGVLAGILMASALVGLLRFFGWAEVEFSDRLANDTASVLPAIVVSLLAFIAVGIFEELVRTYQIRNITEGLANTKFGMTGAMLCAVLLAASWSVLGHAASGNPGLLVYVLITASTYGCFFLWTQRAALAMALHFSWDFMVSSVFLLGAAGNQEPAIFHVFLSRAPGFDLDIVLWSGLVVRIVGLVFIAAWIKWRKGNIRLQYQIATPSLLDNIDSSVGDRREENTQIA